MRTDNFNTNYLDNREYVLMSNIREDNNNASEIDIIPTNYILEYTKKLDDVSALRIEIPKYVGMGDRKIEYPLYNKIKPRQLILIKKDGKPEERFVIEGISESKTRDGGTKTITASSYEVSLKNKTCLINEGMTRQLYRRSGESLDVEDGILNIFEQQTGWKIDEAKFDNLARVEVVQENKSITTNLDEERTYTVNDNTILLEKNVNIIKEEGFPLNFDISWLNIIITSAKQPDEPGYSDYRYEAKDVIHNFTDIEKSVKHIKATFTSNAQERYGITYELTFEDGTKIIDTRSFVNCRDLKLEHNGLLLTVITSEIEEKTIAKYRFLEHQSTYWYQYLKTTIQDAFDCYIFFDSYNKTVEVRDRKTYGGKEEWKGFYLDFENLLTKITKTPKVEDLCTRLWIESSNVDITEVNPLGTSYIENYDYFINNGSMSDSLKTSYQQYLTHIETRQEEWLQLKKRKDVTDQLLLKRNSELASLNEQVKTQNVLLTAYIKADSKANQKRIAENLIELEEQVREKNQVIAQLKRESELLFQQMQLLGTLMSKEGCGLFSEEDLKELEDFTIEQTYTDDVHTKAKALYDYSVELMKNKAKLNYTFSLEHNELVKGIKHPLGWQWFIQVGAKVELDDKDIADADGYVTIYAYTYSPKENKIKSVDFNNNSKVIEAVKGLGAIGKLVHQTSSMTDYWKSTWKEAQTSNIVVSDIRKNGLDLAANIVRGGSIVNKVSMSEAGLFVIDATNGNNENNQIYIGASLVALTNDKWKTCKTAIDTGGVIAETIVGKMILGEQLFISNEDNSFIINPNGLVIKDEFGLERVTMGIENGQTYLNLQSEDDKSHLLFNSDGTLDIKASSLVLTSGAIPNEKEIQNLVNQMIDSKILANKNYALNTNKELILKGDESSEQIFKLYDLIKKGSEFFGKSTALSFSWEYTGTNEATIYARTGGNHNQQLSDTINISETQNYGKVSKVNVILDGEEFEDLELVCNNINGEVKISLLKFEIGENATSWTPSSEDNDTSYNIMLSNENQVVQTNRDLYPLNNTTYETEVLIYEGTKQITDFTIDPISSLLDTGIVTTIDENNKIIFTIDTNTQIKKENGTIDIYINIKGNKYRKSWSWVTVKQQVNGYVRITGDQIFRYENNFTGTPTPSVLTLNANIQGTDAEGKWQYKNIAGAWVDWKVNGLILTDTTLIINPNDANYYNNDIKILQVRYIVDEIYDEFTTYKISDGKKGEDGISAGDAYTIILSNENHSFPCENDGTILNDLSTYSQVLTMKGTKSVPATIDISQIEVPHGMLIKVCNNTEYTANEMGEPVAETSDTVVDETGNVIEYAYLSPEGVMEVVYYNVTDEDANNISDEYDNTLVSESGIWIEFIALGVNSNTYGYYVTDEEHNKLVSEGLIEDAINSTTNFKIGTLADNGTVTIPITVDGFVFNRVFSWSKARKGEQGATANSASIVATSQVFKSKDGKVFTPETITLKPILQNVKYSKWQYSVNGGNRWIDVTDNKNGITIQNGELTLDNDSNLFTETTTSIVFKLLTTDINVYDTITISRLSDGNLDEIKVGIRNLLSKTGTKIKILGSGEDSQLEDIYYLVSGNSTELMGKTITFSCDYEASAGTYGYMSIRTNGQQHENASVGYFELLSDVISLNDNFQGHITKTLTLSDDQSLGFTGIQLCLNNVVGDVTVSNCILTLGDVQVTWVPAPEDGTDYTSELINELRLVDLQEIIRQNQESSNRIDQILGDNVVTSTEKVDLVYDYERATMSKESATNYYYSVNDETMNPLRLSMEEAYEKLTGVMVPILEDMNSDTEIKTDTIKNAFSIFYQAYEALMMALQSSVLIVITKYGTKIEQLDTKIALTASRTEVMENKVNRVDSHFDFTPGGFVEIYATTNGTKGRFATQITDQKLAFKDYGQEVAYISNQEMYITKATITNQLDISHFSIKPSGKGGIMFIYKEE